MIHEIGVELQAKLRAVRCPLPVVDGPEPTQTATNARERIVIEHDGDDRFGPARSQHVNPKQRMTRAIGAKITIFAKSPEPGARPYEHRRRAEHILDLVLVAMGEVAAERKNAWAPTGGRFVRAPDLEASERPGGAVYELDLTFDRAVLVQTWAGEIRPEAALGANSIRSRTNVSLATDDDPTAAKTACGA